MRFIALDIETANRYHSICQIGLAVFEDGQLLDTWESLIDSKEVIEYSFHKVHKIGYDQLQGKPSFIDIYSELRAYIENELVIHHSGEDPKKIYLECLKYGLEPIDASWLDGIRIAQATWNLDSYSLKSISEYLSIKFNHHNALEDALVTGYYVNRALSKGNIQLNDLQFSSIHDFKNLTFPSTLNIEEYDYRYFKNQRIKSKISGSPKGTVVFTNFEKLNEVPTLSQIALSVGFNVDPDVTKSRTNVLVVGNQNRVGFKSQKTGKQNKAEKFNHSGASIEILDEEKFLSLCLENDYLLDNSQLDWVKSRISNNDSFRQKEIQLPPSLSELKSDRVISNSNPFESRQTDNHSIGKGKALEKNHRKKRFRNKLRFWLINIAMILVSIFMFYQYQIEKHKNEILMSHINDIKKPLRIDAVMSILENDLETTKSKIRIKKIGKVSGNYYVSYEYQVDDQEFRKTSSFNTDCENLCPSFIRLEKRVSQKWIQVK